MDTLPTYKIATEVAKLRVGDSVKVTTSPDTSTHFEVTNVVHSSADGRLVEVGLLGKRGAARVLLPGEPWSIGTAESGEWRGRTVRAVQVFCKNDQPLPRMNIDPKIVEEVGRSMGIISQAERDQQAIDALSWPPDMRCRRVEQDGAVSFVVSTDWPSDLPGCSTPLDASKQAWQLFCVESRDEVRRERDDAARREREARARRLEQALGLGWSAQPPWVDRKHSLLTHPETDIPVHALDDAQMLELVEFFARKYAQDLCAVHDLHVAYDRLEKVEKRLTEASAFEQTLRRIGSALGLPASASALDLGLEVALRLAAVREQSTVEPASSSFGEQLTAAGYGHLDPAQRGEKGSRP